MRIGNNLQAAVTLWMMACALFYSGIAIGETNFAGIREKTIRQEIEAIKRKLE